MTHQDILPPDNANDQKRGNMKIKKFRADPILVVGILFSILASLILYLIGLESISSTILALLGILITMQIDQIARLEHNFEKDNYYSKFLRKMDKPEWLFPLVAEIVDSMQLVAVDTTNNTFTDSAKSQLEKCRNHIQDLGRGHLFTEYNDVQPIIFEAGKANTSIKAVSISNVDLEHGFWNSPVGKRFWDANKKAVIKGARLERVFVYQEWNDGLEKVIKEQASFHKNVFIYVIPRENLPVELRIDMTVVDNRFMYAAVLNSDGIPIQNLYSTNQSEINNELNRFTMIRNLADEYNAENFPSKE